MGGWTPEAAGVERRVALESNANCQSYSFAFVLFARCILPLRRVDVRSFLSLTLRVAPADFKLGFGRCSITRGSHMVPLLNTFNIDCSVTGNHDFGEFENGKREREQKLTAGTVRV